MHNVVRVLQMTLHFSLFYKTLRSFYSQKKNILALHSNVPLDQDHSLQKKKPFGLAVALVALQWVVNVRCKVKAGQELQEMFTINIRMSKNVFSLTL